MFTNLYVGNLPWGTTEQELMNLFSQYGEVSSVKIITDRETGRSRGFGFVEMESGAEDALKLDGTELEGRGLKVNHARPKKY
ncbi:MAG: hypothetical protein PWR24_1515 [Desulfonauticus sp.]|jgi:RNA recognition motif-containing protein|nr:MAG: RNP-1 like RNA-binding protein [Desulfonauticus sp. 38_4375]MDK2921958.1 hypothetical protein [Desulfonauticus sp.]